MSDTPMQDMRDACMYLQYHDQCIIDHRYYAEVTDGLGVTIMVVNGEYLVELYPVGENGMHLAWKTGQYQNSRRVWLSNCWMQFNIRSKGALEQALFPRTVLPDILSVKSIIEGAIENWKEMKDEYNSY